MCVAELCSSEKTAEKAALKKQNLARALAAVSEPITQCKTAVAD